MSPAAERRSPALAATPPTGRPMRAEARPLAVDSLPSTTIVGTLHGPLGGAAQHPPLRPGVVGQSPKGSPPSSGGGMDGRPGIVAASSR